MKIHWPKESQPPQNKHDNGKSSFRLSFLEKRIRTRPNIQAFACNTVQPAACSQSSGQFQTINNGFLLAESLLALIVAMITGFLLLTALSALSKSLSLSVPEQMEMAYEEKSSEIPAY